MKRRLGFVTNSSSTNSIISATATALTSGIVSAVINVDTSNEENQIVETAELILEVEASHPDKCLRLNDSDFSVNVFARVVKTTIHYVPAGGGLVIDHVEENYDLTDAITFKISSDTLKWVNTSEPTMIGGYMGIAVVGESIVYENRHFQPNCPNYIYIGAQCQVENYQLSDSVGIKLRDEALLFGRSTYALNDKTVKTKVPLELYNGWPYKWQMEYDASSTEFDSYCSLDIEESEDEISFNNMPGKAFDLVVMPSGKEIPPSKTGAVSYQARIDVKGIPSKNHIPEVTDFLDLTLIEEGLFFEGDTDKKGSLIIESYIHSKAEEASEIDPTRFKILCVVKKEDIEIGGSTAEFIDMSDVELKFDTLVGTNSESESLVQVYRYEIKKTSQAGTFELYPLTSVPYSDKPLNIVLPVSCTINEKDYDLNLPVQIIGQPLGRPEAWDAELKNLIHMIKNYVKPEKQLFYIQQIKAHKNRLSVEGLRLRRRFVWAEARKDLLQEAKDHMAMAEIYEWGEFGASALKWVGDQAFAYLAKYYSGEIGELILVPMKDIIVMLIGELSAEYFFGSGTMTEEQIYVASLNSIISSIENDIMSDFSFEGISLKKVGRYFGALASVNFLKHYMLDTKPDGSPIGFWDAIVSTCSDLTINFFKILVAQKFEALIKMPASKEFFEKYASKYMKEIILKATNNLDFDQINTIGKYLSEITGLLVAEVNGKVIDLAKNTNIKSSGDDFIISIKVTEKLTVKVAVLETSKDLFAYMFDCMFGAFPYAPVNQVVKVPAMPPYYASK